MGRSTTLWFRRLADVSGVDYGGDPSVDLSSLKGRGAVARVRTWEFGDEPRESLQWFDNADAGGGSDQIDEEDWGTSASPCSTWQTKRRRGESASRTLLRQVREALELPGTLRDYHNVLSRGLAEFWNDRASDPPLLAELEALCLLDVRLIEAHPDAVRDEHLDWARAVTARPRKGDPVDDPDGAGGEDEEGGGEEPRREFFYVPAFRHLLELYEREGYLQDALDVARRHTAFGGRPEAVTHLEERVRALASERAGSG